MNQKELLSGIRVLDFGSFLAGPVGAMALAQLGAEVIKVETRKRPDGARFFVQAQVSGAVPDPTYGAQFFNVSNLNKKSLTVDISIPEGSDLIKQLAKKVDIFIENMKPGTMEKHGLGYEDLKEVNPQLIYISSSACGQTGPEKFFIGYAASFANKAGLGHLTGFADTKPSTFVGSIDIRSATMAATAALAALNYRDISGEGQYIDLSSMEAIGSQLGDIYLEYLVNNQRPIRSGNHRPGYAPNSAYPCLGEDEWVSISVFTEEEWQSLCHCMDQPELISDPRFDNYPKRYAHQEKLDEIISAWTVDKGKYAVTELLQKAGVPASPTMNGQDLLSDPHVVARESYSYMAHPAIGRDFVTNPPWRFSETPAKNKRHAPALGEHTVEILKNYLNLSDGEIQELERKNVI